MIRFVRDNRFARGSRLVAVLALVASTVTAVAPGLAAEHPARQNARSGSLWKDPDGAPLPFQSNEEILEFLRTAEIESVTDIELGVTNPRRVVLAKDGVRMRAALRDYDETFTRRRFDGVFYFSLRDAYVFDVPAYELALLLDLNNVPPVTFRRIGRDQVSLQVWLEGGMMETDRLTRGIDPPSGRHFRQQTQNMRVFDSLIGNVDRNSGNILIDGDWNFWLIDHSRAFLGNDDTRYLERVQACSRQLFARLKALTAEEMLRVMSPPLSQSDVNWVLRRRDKVVAHIDALIAEKGSEGAVLFDDLR